MRPDAGGEARVVSPQAERDVLRHCITGEGGEGQEGQKCGCAVDGPSGEGEQAQRVSTYGKSTDEAERG